MGRIEYTSANGFRGVLYGRSSMIVFAPEGNEVFHTGFRAFDTREELIEFVDEMPEFLRMLKGVG